MATKKSSDKKPAVKAADKKPAVKAADKKPAVKAADKKPAVKASDKKPAVKAADKKPFALKLYFKTDQQICTLFVIVDGKIEMELHGNVSSWNNMVEKFGDPAGMQVTDVKEIEQYPDIAVNFETSKIYRGYL